MTKNFTGNDYYRTYAAVDLDVIEHNLSELKKKIKPGVLSLAIVKADAYGHGAVGVAKSIQDKVDYFGIAELGEAVELREAGVEKPVLVLSYTSPYQYETLIKNELTQTIFNYDDAVALSRAAVKLNKIATKVLYGSAVVSMSSILYGRIKKNEDVVDIGTTIGSITGMTAMGYIIGAITNTPDDGQLYK